MCQRVCVRMRVCACVRVRFFLVRPLARFVCNLPTHYCACPIFLLFFRTQSEFLMAEINPVRLIVWRVTILLYFIRCVYMYAPRDPIHTHIHPRDFTAFVLLIYYIPCVRRAARICILYTYIYVSLSFWRRRARYYYYYYYIMRKCV